MLEQFVTIELFGQNYTFKTETDAQKAQKVVDLLQKEVAEVETEQSRQSQHISKLAILIGAALNIANAHFELKRNHSELLESLSQKSADLRRALDSIVA